MRIESFGQSDLGNIRKNNEDSYLIDNELSLFAVADGMGGYAAGEVASQTAMEVVKETLLPYLDMLKKASLNPDHESVSRVRNIVERAVQAACAKIFDLAENDNEKKGMGTTISLLLVIGTKGIIAHVGDSRVYLYRDGKLHQLTEDHTLIQENLRKGLISESEIPNLPYKNIITRAVGIQSYVDVDILPIDVLHQDIYVLCSDGMHQYFNDEEIKKVIESVPSSKLPEVFIKYAKKRGGSDNITSLAIYIDNEHKDQLKKHVKKEIKLLDEIPLFKNCNYRELVLLKSCVFIEEYEENQNIIKEGSEGDKMFIILSGKVKVSKEDKYLGILEEGDHFGEMALVDRELRSATIVSETKTSLMVLNREHFIKIMKEEPIMGIKLLWNFVIVLSRRLRTANRDLANLRKTVDTGIRNSDEINKLFE